MFDRIHNAALEGIPAGIQVIDVHSHIGRYGAIDVIEHSPESLIKRMDKMGISMACISSVEAATFGDPSKGNLEVIKAVRRYPDRFRGLCTINPSYTDIIGEEIEKTFSTGLFAGLKLHPYYHKTDIACSRYMPAYEIADDAGCLILIHVTDKRTIDQLDELSSQYKNVKFVMGHAGGDIDDQYLEAHTSIYDVVDVVNRRENVFIDLAFHMIREGLIEWLVSEIGAGKIFYGTDMPFFDPTRLFSSICCSDLSVEDKIKILGSNLSNYLSCPDN